MSTETLENKRNVLNSRSIELNRIIKDCERKIGDYAARLQLLEQVANFKKSKNLSSVNEEDGIKDFTNRIADLKNYLESSENELKDIEPVDFDILEFNESVDNLFELNETYLGNLLERTIESLKSYFGYRVYVQKVNAPKVLNESEIFNSDMECTITEIEIDPRLASLRLSYSQKNILKIRLTIFKFNYASSHLTGEVYNASAILQGKMTMEYIFEEDENPSKNGHPSKIHIDFTYKPSDGIINCGNTSADWLWLSAICNELYEVLI